MPFLLAAMRCVARSHLVNGTCERSITEPVRQVNFLRQSRQESMPACVLPPMRSTLKLPQNGQWGPCGQRDASMCACAAASSWKIGSERFVAMGLAPYGSLYRALGVKSSTPSRTKSLTLFSEYAYTPGTPLHRGSRRARRNRLAEGRRSRDVGPVVHGSGVRFDA